MLSLCDWSLGGKYVLIAVEVDGRSINETKLRSNASRYVPLGESYLLATGVEKC